MKTSVAGIRRVAAHLVVLFAPFGLQGPAAEAACPTSGGPWGQVHWLRERKEFFGAAQLALDHLYKSDAPEQKRRALACLTDTYVGAGQWQRAVGTWSELRSYLSPEEISNWAWGMGILATRRTDVQVDPEPPAAIFDRQLDARQRRWLGGMFAIRRHDWAGAKREFAELTVLCSGDAAKSLPACRIARRMGIGLDALPIQRSPGLAVAMSAAVPGSGLLYADHRFDALLYGGTTLGASWLAWDSRLPAKDWLEQRPSTYVLAAGALLIYIANLVATHDTVQRTNEVHAWRFESSLTPGAWPQLPDLASDVTDLTL